MPDSIVSKNRKASFIMLQVFDKYTVPRIGMYVTIDNQYYSS